MSLGSSESTARRGRWWVLLALLGCSLAIGYGLVQLAIRKPGPTTIKIAGAEPAQQTFGGVPQSGDRLGSSDAPVAIQVFTDVQCETCRSQFLTTIPPLVTNQVRSGQVKLLLRNRSVTENQTELGFYGVEAAGKQGYSWSYAYLFFRNQEEAKRVGIDNQFLEAVGGSIAELDIDQFKDDLERGLESDSKMTERLKDQDETAADLKIRAGPAAVLTGPGGTRVLQDAPDLNQIERAIDQVR